MRRRYVLVHVFVLAAFLAVGFGEFQAVGAVTSETSPKPKLVLSLDEPGREVFECRFDLLAYTSVKYCTVPAGKRLVLRHITFEVAAPTGNVGLLGLSTVMGPISHVDYLTASTRLGGALIGSFDGVIYSEGNYYIAFSNQTSGSSSVTGTATGDLLDCNRILAGTTTITADCNVNSQAAVELGD